MQNIPIVFSNYKILKDIGKKKFKIISKQYKKNNTLTRFFEALFCYFSRDVVKTLNTALLTQPHTKLRNISSEANYSRFRCNCLLSVTSTLENGLVIQMVISEQNGTFLRNSPGCKVEQCSLNCYGK